MRFLPLHVTLLVAVSPLHAESFDVAVYGATPGGIAAAVSAAKGGQTVVLIEPSTRIGGMMTSGLSYADFRSFESLTGFFLGFARRVEADYRTRYGAGSEQQRASFRGTHGEPGVNLRVLERMLAEQPRVRVVKRHALAAVEMSPFAGGRRRIIAARFAAADSPAPVRVEARVFIDATYEGDLMAMTGESYHVGRESRAQYGETLAGNERGEADGQVQGYNFRLVMTDVPENRVPVGRPDGYRREDFTGVLPHFATGRLEKVFSTGHDGIYRFHDLPNGKADVNDTPHAPVRLSMPDVNDTYPEGDPATRARIVREHLADNIGLLYFLQTDDAVPAAIRADARRWGWCKDEFTESGHLPPQLYIREARRLVGQHVFTEGDTAPAPGVVRARLHSDSIAIGDYVHNCHGTGRTGTRFDGRHTGEFYKPVPPYQVPYGVIVPQKTVNLLVPVACSASHAGFAALRLEPVWCALGQAAGWAVHRAVIDGVPVQSVDVPALQRRLHADGSATVYLSDVSPDSPHFVAAQWFGTRGAFHGLTDGSTTSLPEPESLGGQYNAAFPGHFAGLDKPAGDALARKWLALFAEESPATPVADGLRGRAATMSRGALLDALFRLLQE